MLYYSILHYTTDEEEKELKKKSSKATKKSPKAVKREAIIHYTNSNPNTTLSYTLTFDTILKLQCYHTIQYDTIRCYTILYYTIRCCARVMTMTARPSACRKDLWWQRRLCSSIVPPARAPWRSSRYIFIYIYP